MRVALRAGRKEASWVDQTAVRLVLKSVDSMEASLVAMWAVQMGKNLVAQLVVH